MDKLPFKKEHLLLAGTVIMLLACYQLAFKPTITAWQLHRELAKRSAIAADVTIQPAYYERKERNLTKAISRYQLDSVTFRNNVVNKIAALAEQHQVKLTGVPADDAIYHTGALIVQKVDLEGDFFNLLRLVDTVQHTKDIGIMRAATWKMTKVTGASETKKLGLELYMEMYRGPQGH